MIIDIIRKIIGDLSKDNLETPKEHYMSLEISLTISLGIYVAQLRAWGKCAMNRIDDSFAACERSQCKWWCKILSIYMIGVADCTSHAAACDCFVMANRVQLMHKVMIAEKLYVVVQAARHKNTHTTTNTSNTCYGGVHA